MIIYIEGHPADLKKGTSVEYISENRLFSDSDGYTLSITFPLAGSARNTAIFGNINRPDVAAGKVIFDAEIRDANLIRSGCLVITEISDSEVKAQFLDGRSEQNFDDTFDNLYINEMDLGSPASTDPAAVSVAKAWDHTADAVALPWVSDASGMIQNEATHSEGSYSWHEDTKGLSWMPYLHHITTKICTAAGYSVDLGSWLTDDRYRYILICNTLPWVWDQPEYAAALPHWTVEDYLRKLELFLSGEFEIDHRLKKITFRFSHEILDSIPPVSINPIDGGYSEDISATDPQCEYRETRNIGYKEQSVEKWKFWNCHWFIGLSAPITVRYDTIRALVDDNFKLRTWDGTSSGRGTNRVKLLYAADVDTYFVCKTVDRRETGNPSGQGPKYSYKCELQPVNIFAPRINDQSRDADIEEIDIIPVNIDYTDHDHGRLPFLPFSGDSSGDSGDVPDLDHDIFLQTRPAQYIIAGEKGSASEYYDSIYVGYYKGEKDPFPVPHVEDVRLSDDWTQIHTSQFSFRLTGKRNDPHRMARFNIDNTRKVTFKFLSDHIPDVRALFHIHGKRYVCEKITANITEHGLSAMMKGTFYPIED